MADLVEFKKKQGKFYAVIKNSQLRSATVELYACWNGRKGAPVDRIQVTGSDNETTRIFTKTPDGVNDGSFKVSKDGGTDYEIVFDKKADIQISSDDSKKLIVNKPLPTKQQLKDGTFILKGGGDWGITIPDGIAKGSYLWLQMERDDDSKDDGRALTAVELPVGDAENKMSFSSGTGYETEEEKVEIDSVSYDGKRFFPFKFSGTNGRIRRESPPFSDSTVFGDDGRDLPNETILKFNDETGSFNAFLYIREKNLEVDKTSGDPLELFLEVKDAVLETPEVICKKNPKLAMTCPAAGEAGDDFEIKANFEGVSNSNTNFSWYEDSVGPGTLLQTGLGETKLTGTYPATNTTKTYIVVARFTNDNCDKSEQGSCVVSSKEPDLEPAPECNKRLEITLRGEFWETNADGITTVTATEGSPPLEISAFSVYQDEIDNDGITWTLTEDNGDVITGTAGNPNTFKMPFASTCGTSRRWTLKAEWDDLSELPAGVCNLRTSKEIETKTTQCAYSDETPASPTKCGTQPPVIAQRGNDWGIEIPSNVINTSTVFLHFEKRDRPDEHGTAISKVSIVGSDGAKNTLRLGQNVEVDSTEGSFRVTTSYGTFYKFTEMDNAKEPLYNANLDRLEFRDQHENDANAWLEVKNHVFNCDEIGEIIGPDECFPGPWTVDGVEYDPNAYQEATPPSIDNSGGGRGLQCSKEGEKDIILDLSNYRNQLVTLQLTYNIDSTWTQHFDFDIPNCSDLYINNSRHGSGSNEYNVPAFSQSTNTADNQVFKIYNLDGGHKYRFKHDNDVGPEPIRDVFEKVCVEEEVTVGLVDSTATILHTFDDVNNVNISDTPKSNDSQVSVQALGLSNSGGGNTVDNKHYEITFNGLELPITSENFNQVSITGVSDQTASNPPDGVAPDGGGPGFTSGVSFGKTTEYVSQNKMRVWFNKDGVNSFVRNFDVNFPGGSTATRVDTICNCELVGTESWTDTGKNWPRFQPGVYVTKSSGNSVSWVYEDGSGTATTNPDDVFITVTVMKVRDTLPSGTIGMGDLKRYVWLSSDTPDAPYNFGPVDGQSLADWYDHSEKKRIRNPSEKRSLTNLRASGVEYTEFIGAAAAPYEAF